MKKVIVIAEAGVNHNGNIHLAKKLIDIAAGAGADYVKFQTWVTDELIDKSAPKAKYQKKNDGENTTQYEMLKKLELSFSQFRELKKYAEKKRIKFLSTPDDYSSLDFLTEKLNLPIIKIGSGEVTNIPFLRRIGKKKKDIILSTGMSTLNEVRKAYSTLKAAGAKVITLLHCTSNYPAPLDSVNLKAMQTLAEEFKTRIGYSDHTETSEAAIAAVALGASVIEKHFTIDKSLPGPDHKASLNPEELKLFIKQIRNTELVLKGSGKKEPHSSEIETKKVVQKGIYLFTDIKKNEIITDGHLIMKRPVDGIEASDYDSIIGKKVNKNIFKGSSLHKTDIAIE